MGDDTTLPLCGFYTPDLAMADIKEGDQLLVVFKDYNPDRDMVYWVFERLTGND